ncbi:uncharacterized protein LOC120006909 isoform X2 [Tripterygium wilfordii]|uniref:uncharacterized protein LOC120006909 isoform X2 n=1 Tax=Tripterygium wilfordii TaxID=458696 RepID=UPI0018F833A5|nr:uncharacterized protein LOC120006909 isoform X2 [Tripterygium wilfordii]
MEASGAEIEGDWEGWPRLRLWRRLRCWLWSRTYGSICTYAGAGIGPGIPGLQFGFGIGAGCGIGLGFGYGGGWGIAHDENKMYSNVGKLFHGQRNFPSQDEISSLIDELVINTKKLVRATSKEIEKWRR